MNPGSRMLGAGRGGIVPAPPRSGTCESCDGLPAVLPARIAGEGAIADEWRKRRKMKQMIGEGKETDSPPLRVRGGGNPSEDEKFPFAGFVDPNERDMIYISEKTKEFNTPDVGECLFDYIEDVMIGILDPSHSRRKKEHHAMLMTNVIKEVTTSLSTRATKASKQCKELQGENTRLVELQTVSFGAVNGMPIHVILAV